MIAVFWNMEGPILVHFTPKGETVNSDSYCELPQELKAKFKSKRHGKLSKGVIQLQDNAQTRTSYKTN